MADRPRRKQYVEVIATHRIDGTVRPQQITFAAGPIYEIADVKSVVKVQDPVTKEVANQYTIEVRGKQTWLFEDCGRWFVKMKA